MSNKSIYTSVIISKTGTQVPAFSDGKTAESKYNPEREAENLILAKIQNNELSEGLNCNFSYFFIVTGICSGTLIEKLSEQFPGSKILAVENSNDDLLFLEKLEKIQKLKENNSIILTDIDNIEKSLINNYLPAMYKDLKIIEQRGWMEKNKSIIESLTKKINKAVGIISADFSVQTHFGKIWQSNIINNLKTLSFAKNKIISTNIKDQVNLNKTAAIIAAGPSLDKSIKKIIESRKKYFIIATDTSFSVLIKNKIIPDVVISIDGQHISHNHFFNSNICKNTIFLLDLCSDYSVGKFLQNSKNNVVYFISGHPLSLLANTISDKKFLELFSGAGTVTITAMDFATKLGFSDIEIFGADFSYSNGKSYTKGTYFDTIFNLNNSKLNTTEKMYSNLMYRTELIKISNNQYSTDILTAYKLSLEQYLADNKYIFTKEDDIYRIKTSCPVKNNNGYLPLQSFSYDFDNFIKVVKNASLEDLEYPLLPCIAWLKNKKNNESLEFIALLKLAQSNIVRYN